MMRIALSQRVDMQGSERRDALDQRWCALLEYFGLQPLPVPNALQDPQGWARAAGIAGLLLTGGNDLATITGAVNGAPERDRTERLLLALAESCQWPVLGVCRGMQMLNCYLGGSLTPVLNHVAVSHPVQPTNHPCRFFKPDMPGRSVNSFHNYGISPDQLAHGLTPILTDARGFVEAAEHRALPWAAIMWHPERDAIMAAEDKHLISTLFQVSAA